MQPSDRDRITEFLTRYQGADDADKPALSAEAIALLSHLLLTNSNPDHGNNAMDKAKVEKILRGLGHNINGIMASMLGMVEITRMREPELSPNVDDVFNKIAELVARAIHTTDLARMYGKVLSWRPSVQGVDLLVRRVTNDCRMAYSLPYAIELDCDVGQMQAAIDATQFTQMVELMVKNAIEAISQAQPEHPKISISAQSKNDLLIVEISDNGIGVNAEDGDKVFAPFYSSKPPAQGIGLGLAIVKQIVDNHKGNISYQSKAGKGTCFSITLPVSS